MVYGLPVLSGITYLTVPVPQMVIPEKMLSRVPEVWSLFRVTNYSLNGMDMSEAQVSKYGLTFFTVEIVIELDTMDLHVSDSGVSS